LSLSDGTNRCFAHRGLALSFGDCCTSPLSYRNKSAWSPKVSCLFARHRREFRRQSAVEMFCSSTMPRLSIPTSSLTGPLIGDFLHTCARRLTQRLKQGVIARTDLAFQAKGHLWHGPLHRVASPCRWGTRKSGSGQAASGYSADSRERCMCRRHRVFAATHLSSARVRRA